MSHKFAPELQKGWENIVTVIGNLTNLGLPRIGIGVTRVLLVM